MVPLDVWILPNLALSSWVINSKENSLLSIKFYFDLREIILSGFGTNPLLGSPFLILSINSIPLVTFPKAEYCLSKWGAESKQIKNWLFALSGSADLAAEIIPLVWATSVNSAFKLGKSEPPVPASDKLKSALFEFPNFTSRFEPWSHLLLYERLRHHIYHC